MNIFAFYPGSNLSKRAKTYPYLLRNIDVTRPNQVWAIDITHIGTPNGFVYLTAIIDWYSRFIAGYGISNTLQTDTVIHGAPEIINSDQGSQFTSSEYIDLIKSYGSTKIRMDGKSISGEANNQRLY